MNKSNFKDLKVFYCGENRENVIMFMNKETYETILELIDYADHAAKEKMTRENEELF